MNSENRVLPEGIEGMQRTRPTCGNPMLDFYWLGFDAGMDAGIRNALAVKVAKLEQEIRNLKAQLKARR